METNNMFWNGIFLWGHPEMTRYQGTKNWVSWETLLAGDWMG